MNEIDNKKCFEFMYKVEGILFDEMLIIFIYFYNYVFLIKDNVSGIVCYFVGYLDLKWVDKQ